MQDRTIFVDGLKSHYILLGSRKNPPLLLVHSFHNNAQTTLPIGFAMEKKFHVILPDLPGFGLSDPFPRHRFSIETAADFLVKFLSALKLKKCYLMGISMGGAIVSMMAALTPDRFSGIILFHPLFSGEHISFPRKKTVMKLLRLSQFRFTSYAVEYMFSKQVIAKILIRKLNRPMTEKYLAWRLQNLFTCTPKTYLDALYSILSYTPDITSTLNIPTTLIINPHDNLIDPIKTQRGYQSIFPRLSLHQTAFESHNPTPDDVMHFLKKNQMLTSQIIASLLA